MNTTRNLALCLGLAAALVSPALAQRPGGQGQGGPGRFGQGLGMGMQGGMVQLHRAEPVQRELDLTEEQVEQLRPIGESYRGELMGRMQEMRDQLDDLSPEERRERFEQMSRELNDSSREEIAAVLKPEQVERLEQIQLQQRGVQAFADPRVAEKLGLSDEQKSEIREILGSYREEVRSMMEASRDSENPREAIGKLNDLRSSSMDKAVAVLSEEQRSTWEEMTGEPFEMGPGVFGRGGFGPGGPGGPGRGGRPGGGGRPPVDN